MALDMSLLMQKKLHNELMNYQDTVIDCQQIIDGYRDYFLGENYHNEYEKIIEHLDDIKAKYEELRSAFGRSFIGGL